MLACCKLHSKVSWSFQRKYIYFISLFYFYQFKNFFIFRHKYSSCHFVLPVIVYSLSYNIPKFFEFTVACPPWRHLHGGNLTDFNEEDTNASVSYVQLESDNSEQKLMKGSDDLLKTENTTQGSINDSWVRNCSFQELQMAANSIR